MRKNERDNKIGERIKENRQKLRLSMSQLGTRIGVSATSISLYESGDRYPKFEQIKKMADVFGIPVQLLMGDHSNIYSDLEDSDDLILKNPLLAYLQSQGVVIKYDSSNKSYVLVLDYYEPHQYPKSFVILEKDLDRLNSGSMSFIHTLISFAGREYGTALEDYRDIDELHNGVAGSEIGDIDQ